MKRRYIILICLSLTTTAFAQQLKHEKCGIAGKAGISLFNGDVPNRQSADLNFAAGAAVDYYFAPQAGFIVEYLYTPISARLPDFNFAGRVHTAAIYASANVLNMVNPYRRPRWNLFINLGVGVSCYSSKSTTGTPRQLTNETCATFPVEMALEYNINSWWAVLGGVQYRFQNKDNFEAMRDKQGNSNDGLYVATIALKYKFHKRPRSSYGTNFCR